MRVWVTGGFFDASGECFVDEIDLKKGERTRRLGFVPPGELRMPRKGFTGARWLDARTLLVAGSSAVWRFDVRSWAVAGVLHQSDFNDLHDVHVDHSTNRIYICNTGLDAIEVFDLTGRFIGRHSLSPAWFDARRQQGMAVKRDEFTKLVAVGWTPTVAPEIAVATAGYYGAPAEHPFHKRVVRDYAHPDHVCLVDGRLAVTLLATREVRCLHTLETLASFDGHPHDGEAFDGLLWTTTTDGGVYGWSPGVPWRVVESYQTSATGHVGWCRGLRVTDEGLAVALTRMHGASQYTWRPDPIERTETSVLWLERRSGRLLGRVEYRDDRRAKLFAVLPTASPT